MTKARDNATQGGLVLVGTQSLSAVSEVNFTNLLPGTKYKITGSIYGSVSGAIMRINAKEDATLKSTGYYGASYRALYNNSSAVHYYSSNATLFSIFNYHTSAEQPSVFNAEVYISPSKTSMTLHGTAYDYYTNGSLFFGCENHAMTNCNGINFNPSLGTLSGTMSIYKYKE